MKYVTVKVLPNAPKTQLREVLENGVQKIAVAATPEKGKANKELIRFLQKEWGKTVRIVSGEHDRVKLLRVGE